MENQHAIDKLYFDINVKSETTNVQKVERLSKTLDKLAGVVYDFPTASFDKISENLVKLGNAFNTLTASNKQISGLSTRLNNLNKKISDIDVSAMKSKFEQMASAITPFIDKVSSAQDSLTALNGIINGSDKIQKTPKTSTSLKKTSSGVFGLPKLFKVSMLLHLFRKIGNVMGDIVTKGADFGETLNLWQVSMGKDFLPQATEFVNKLNEAYGISKKTLMNSQAIFKNMLGSLGEISEGTAYALSEGITQMALDYASLYNVQFDQAMTKFQAALAGQVRPIRSVAGYDITENTLFQLYQSLGGTKTMRQLSRTEKQLLSIYAVFEQMERSGAVGDLDRTMESFANQSRVMAETWSDIKTYAGLTVTKLLQQSKVMQYVNAGLIFASRILEALAGTIDVDLGNTGDPFANVTEGATEATEATENLKSTLLSFDKFQALNNSNGENALGIDTKLLNAITKYDSILSKANLEAGKLADKWLENLGGLDTIVSKITTFFGDIEQSQAFSLIGEMYETFSKLYSIFAGDNGLGYWSKEFFTNLDNDVFGTFASIFRWFNDTILTEETIDGLDGLLQWVKDLNEELKKTNNPFERLYISIEKIFKFFRDELGFGQMGKDISNSWNDFWGWVGSIGTFAGGGLPDKGSMFIAGEAGAELVANMGGGQSGVMNMQQLESAVARGMLIGLSSVDLHDDRPIYVTLDGQNFLTISRDVYKRNGYDLVTI